MHEPVCAIVVTFRPGAEVLHNLALSREQVDGMIVVDNGPRALSAQMLRKAAAEGDFALLENSTNLGIAAALNVGIRHAQAEGYKWVLLLDQDSTITPGFVDAMFAYVTHDDPTSRGKRNTALYCPIYKDRSTGKVMPPELTRKGALAVARTSGSLIPTWVFAECGWFVEEMVIDQVDYEFCLRLRRHGYGLALCEGATLIHSLGAPTVHRLFGRRIFGTTNHSAARRYYLVRNRTWLLKRYWARSPVWCAGLCIATLKESVKILVAEDRRWSKLSKTLLGLRDGLTGKMGMTVEL